MSSCTIRVMVLSAVMAHSPHIRAEVWGTFSFYKNFMSNKSLYVDRQSQDYSQFGFDLELNVGVTPDFYIGVAAEGLGKSQPGFTQAAGRLTLNYALTKEFEIYGYHRSAHNLDQRTVSPGYGFYNDNHIGIRVKFGASRHGN